MTQCAFTLEERRQLEARTCPNCGGELHKRERESWPRFVNRVYCSRACDYACRPAREFDPEGPNPSGLCQCGCGERTSIARHTATERGIVAGKPLRFVSGHQLRSSPHEYLVDPETGCWVWQRSITPHGYGQITVGGRNRGAHRVIYERKRGPIPAGLDLDHLCRNRACVNPDHLEPVTRGENLRRGYEARRLEAAA